MKIAALVVAIITATASVCWIVHHVRADEVVMVSEALAPPPTDVAPISRVSPDTDVAQRSGPSTVPRDPGDNARMSERNLDAVVVPPRHVSALAAEPSA